jgi:hypothetical protein
MKKIVLLGVPGKRDTTVTAEARPTQITRMFSGALPQSASQICTTHRAIATEQAWYWERH